MLSDLLLSKRSKLSGKSGVYYILQTRISNVDLDRLLWVEKLKEYLWRILF